MGTDRLTLQLADESRTQALGRDLAHILPPGTIVGLTGDLGVGKSTLARALIRGIMADPDLEVPSPSFSLVQPYERAGRRVLHADLYRLADASEIDELGLFDDADAILLVEWPERAPDLLAKADLVVALVITPEAARSAEIFRRNASIDLAGLTMS